MDDQNHGHPDRLKWRTDWGKKQARTPLGRRKNVRMAARQAELVKQEERRTPKDPAEYVDPSWWRRFSQKECPQCKRRAMVPVGGADVWFDRHQTWRCEYCLHWSYERILQG